MRRILLSCTWAVALVTGALAVSSEAIYASAGRDRTVHVTGTLERGAWLGLSAYPKQGAGYHSVRQVGGGQLREDFYLSGRYAGGTFEVAVWERKVSRSSCKTKGGCSWCHLNGFHMEGMRSYSSGVVGR